MYWSGLGGVQQRWEADPSFGPTMRGSHWGFSRLSSHRECPEAWSSGCLGSRQEARFLPLSPPLHRENLILRKDLKKPVLPTGFCRSWLPARWCILTEARNFQVLERWSG